MRPTRTMREAARLAGVDPRDDAAVVRWERERAARMAAALERLGREGASP